MSREPESSARLLAIGGVLLALLVLSYALAQVDLGPWSAAVALAIAGIKAALVVYFFMELSHASASMRLAGVVVIFFFAVLLALTAADPATRAPPAALPPGLGS